MQSKDLRTDLRTVPIQTAKVLRLAYARSGRQGFLEDCGYGTFESAHRLANLKNLVILSEIEAAGADAVEGPSHRFAYCTNLNCEDPSTRFARSG